MPPLVEKVSVAVSPASSSSSYSFEILWTSAFIFPQISEVEMGRTSTEAQLQRSTRTEYQLGLGKLFVKLGMKNKLISQSNPHLIGDGNIIDLIVVFCTFVSFVYDNLHDSILLPKKIIYSV